ncbi:type IV secretion system protein VirD [Rhizobium altiplani]|uniref:Type IV secretion system protein VirD n=1 Tax=Rhizobium altiplani TaxID=1864509 RepID=A0A109JNI4_9HYPH|nr:MULTISPECIES: relaxase/mobilization nuclease domain-containing protein [Rhizobium]KWV52134.1 type IV secretion system protein VirD [Rhizobium altiplani]
MPDRAQVIIRIVPGGGTRTVQQLINQLEYLSRKGKLELQRSARHLDIPLLPDQIHELAQSWVHETGNYDESQPDEERLQELTTHIIVSFPAGTNQAAAHAASREWAAEMFGSGKGGGRYNYLTAFHIDRDHPHLHVVVNRRELLGHDWLKISRRHPQLNYEDMRKRMAVISFRHGIILDASSRRERGITERPITYAEYRRLEREQVRQIRFQDSDPEPSSERGDHPELRQPFDPSPLEAPVSGPEGVHRDSDGQDEPQVRLQKPAAFRNETGGCVRDSRRRSQRPQDDKAGPREAKRVSLKGAEVVPEANAEEQDYCGDSFMPQAETPRPSSSRKKARASTADRRLCATDDVEQPRGTPSKRPYEEDEGEPNERKRARDGGSRDRPSGKGR